MLSRGYIDWLEKLPCNRKVLRRSRPVGQWLNGWVPEPREQGFTEQMQQSFIEKDSPDGAMARLKRLVGQG
jgi:hypothetical protein